MTNRATDLNRILLLLLCACLLLPLFPGAAAEDNLPCAAELSAGAVFYTGRDLKEAIGTLEKAAEVRVTETDNEAVRITCRLAGKPFEAWVNRKNLRLQTSGQMIFSCRLSSRRKKNRLPMPLRQKNRMKLKTLPKIQMPTRSRRKTTLRPVSFRQRKKTKPKTPLPGFFLTANRKKRPFLQVSF